MLIGLCSAFKWEVRPRKNYAKVKNEAKSDPELETQ